MRLTSLRASTDRAPYENHAPLIELFGAFLLPSGRTRGLRVLFDIGATNNFVSEKLRDRYGLRMLSTRMEPVLLGDQQTTRAGGKPPRSR